MNFQSSIYQFVRASAVAIALTGGTFAANVAIASQPGEDLKQQTVKFADLNLERPEGVAALYRRLRSAALNVCEPHGVRGLEIYAGSRACVADSIKRAVESVGNPALSAYYNAKMGNGAARVATND